MQYPKYVPIYVQFTQITRRVCREDEEQTSIHQALWKVHTYVSGMLNLSGISIKMLSVLRPSWVSAILFCKFLFISFEFCTLQLI